MEHPDIDPDKLTSAKRMLEVRTEYRMTQDITYSGKQLRKQAAVYQYREVDPSNPYDISGAVRYSIMLLGVRLPPMEIRLDSLTTLQEVYDQGFDIAEQVIEKKMREQQLMQGTGRPLPPGMN